MRWLLAVLFLLFCTPVYAEEPDSKPKPVTHTITDDPGGEILSFIARFVQWRDAGDSVRIEGECNSACTLVLGIIPSDRICATRNAEFGFHSAMLVFGPGMTRYSEEGTQLLWFFYQDRVRRVLTKNGWAGPSAHPELLVIDALEIVRPCKWEDYH